MKTSERITLVEQAIAVTKRCGNKPQVRFVRYLNVLRRLAQWEHKLLLAENRVKKYRRRRHYYERWMKFNKND